MLSSFNSTQPKHSDSIAIVFKQHRLRHSFTVMAQSLRRLKMAVSRYLRIISMSAYCCPNQLVYIIKRIITVQIHHPSPVLLVSLLPHLWYQRKGKHPYSSLPFPPGPKRLPFIGNLFNLPRGHDASVYRDWSREFGSEIVHLDVIGMHAIVVNSAKAAREIFEKRSLLYSDRPSFLVLNKMLGFRWALGFMPYGRKWRNTRKAFHSCFNSTASLRYHRLDLQASHELLRRLLDTPQAFVEHVRHVVVDLILEIAYGSNMRSMGDTGDDYVIIAEKTLDAMLIGSTPHAVLLDLFPIRELALL
ncbi:cytochrome P450 monooxygenase 74 [Heterobasidion irregulare TC 32-1]|uniref:Cytochrome P450 monooxygenase 74 n=1 Tax=Heterobasidion irregulare (strain TC 32-1) TaxID=747525 RepID=W4JTW5_HETIT|nr:cytochrome P450 monooxygenase 74 [Heterobasidion irregulare TC 32-1]ETW76894.1 cytochrome P450 monooxygenase 74 [Heterobasidion irregulare TC 32-1]